MAVIWIVVVAVVMTWNKVNSRYNLGIQMGTGDGLVAGEDGEGKIRIKYDF